MATVKMRGSRELDDFLGALPKTLVKGAVRSALTAAAAVIRDEAKAQAPKASGLLAKSIRTGSSRVNQDGTVSIRIRTVGKHAYLAPWIEYGSNAHAIKAKPDKDGSESALKFGGYFAGSVMHPGTSPKPFLRPAADIAQARAINVFGQKMQSYLKSKTGLTAPLLQADDEDY